MRTISFIFLLLILVVGIAFSAMNAKSIPVHYLLGTRELPLVFVLFIAFMLGVVLSFLMMSLKVIKLKSKVHGLNSKLKKIEEDMAHFQDKSQ